MAMEKEIIEEITSLKNKPISQLQKEFEKVFDGQKVSSNNKVYLTRKIAYRLQELEFGELSDKAKDKLQELIIKYDPINNQTLRPGQMFSHPAKIANRDRRLPIPGTIITKEYKSTKYQVKVLEKGFEYSGKIHRTLTAVAREITGAHWNGYLFFNL